MLVFGVRQGCPGYAGKVDSAYSSSVSTEVDWRVNGEP